MERVLASRELARSPQLAKFFRYIVTEKLDGNEGAIKAYAIAVDVFGRPASFDPQADPIVRVQARRLRAAIDSFYASNDPPKVRIYLPVGGYVPEFEGIAVSPPMPDERRSLLREARGRSPLAAWLSEAGVITGLLVVALGIAIVATNLVRSPQARFEVPTPPKVILASFVPVRPSDDIVPLGGLVVELVTDLKLFDNIDVEYTVGNSATGSAEDVFLLNGIVRVDGGQVRTTASLRETNVDTALWTHTVTVPVSDIGNLVDDISRDFAQQLGSRRGPLHRRAMETLDAVSELRGRETEYVCELLFAKARDTQARSDLVRATDCVNGLLFKDQNSAAGLAMSATLTADSLLHELPPDPDDPGLWDDVEAQLLRAISLAPTNSFVWELRARYLDARGHFAEAANAYLSARQLNPANLDMLAAYGRMLLLQGASAEGRAIALMATSGEQTPPPWYYTGLAVDALRSGDDVQAMVRAAIVERTDTELASVIAATAAARQNSETALNRALAQLLEVTRFKRFGIVPVLRQRIRDEVLVNEIADTLRKAGVTEEQLSRGSPQ